MFFRCSLRPRSLRPLWSRSLKLALTPKVRGAKNGPPKNLKVLTPENLMAQMQTFPAALGVENQGGCNFCHEADRSLDTKHAKVKARQMIELVTEINAKFGDGKVHVTCWTCHLGSTMPEIARNPKQVGILEPRLR